MKLTKIPEIYKNINALVDQFYQEFIVVDSHNIQEKILNHSANCTFIMALNAYAQKQVGEAELYLENAFNKARDEGRTQIISSGTRATDKAVEAKAENDPEVQTRKIELVEAKYKANLIKSLSIGMQNQKDMLIQISANQRAENKLLTE